MRKKYLFILLIFLVVGFAAISTRLDIDGFVGVAQNVDDINLFFSAAKENGVANSNLIKEKNVIEISPILKSVGDEYILDYEVMNGSFQYDLVVSFSIEGVDSNYISVSNEFDINEIIAAQNKKEGKLKVRLNKSLTTATTFKIKIVLNYDAKSRTEIGKVVYSNIEKKDTFIENNVVYFKLYVANFIDDKLVSPNSDYRITVENLDNTSKGEFYFIDSYGNLSDSSKQFKTVATSQQYRFNATRDSNIFKIYVKSTDSNNRNVRVKVSVISSLNISVMTEIIEVPPANMCLENNITKLSDCMIALDSMNLNLDVAKNKIKAKTVNFAKIEPVLVYTKKEEKNVVGTNVASTNTLVWFSEDEPSFYSDRGRYQITSSKRVLGRVEDYISTTDKKYYTCLSSGTDVCSVVYVIYDYTSTTSNGVTTYKITKADRYTVAEGETSSSSPGLYAAVDDYGDSYYYRGSVTNNYVKYAGFIWRIVRRNGDGSVRMVYSGTSTNSMGDSASIGNSAFNSNFDDPAYVGYKYGLNQVLKHASNSIIYNVVPVGNIAFADNYICDNNTKKCKLSGNIVVGSWTDKQDEVLGKYKYTCFNSSTTATCGQVSEIVNKAFVGGVFNPNQAIVKYHGFYSNTYADTFKDNIDSTIKVKIDKWYEDYILNKKDANNNLYENYLADGDFCSDRTVTSGNKDDVVLGNITRHAPNTRMASSSPTYKCSNINDRFNKKSGKLKYPIGTLTIDDVLFAGGRHSASNSAYYLYTGGNYLIMSPSGMYADWWRSAFVYNVQTSGSIFQTRVNTVTGVRPVINLKPSIQIVKGNGTKESPYELTI